MAQYKNMELYSNENNFNIFYEKKRRDLKNLQMLNEFVKPNPYFVYFMFKDTIHVDDYGSIKETLFKFPTLNKVSREVEILISLFEFRVRLTKPAYICLEMM